MNLFVDLTVLRCGVGCFGFSDLAGFWVLGLSLLGFWVPLVLDLLGFGFAWLWVLLDLLGVFGLTRFRFVWFRFTWVLIPGFSDFWVFLTTWVFSFLVGLV